MVHACQKYGKCASKKVKKVAKSIKSDDAEDFAKTKHKGLPKKKSFSEWLKDRDPELYEVATSTADIAGFARPVLGMVRRGGDPWFRNKKKKKQK